jgi:hypothetical protein
VRHHPEPCLCGADDCKLCRPWSNWDWDEDEDYESWREDQIDDKIAPTEEAL